MMEKITKKEFIEKLMNGKSRLIGCPFSGALINRTKCRDDAWINKALQMVDDDAEKLDLDDFPVRTVVKSSGHTILFSNGSRLDLDQEGDHSYYSFNGKFEYLIMKTVLLQMPLTSVWDEFDEMSVNMYTIYRMENLKGDIS